MQKFCTLLNDTQKNKMTLLSVSVRDAEILHLVQCLNRLKFTEPNNHAEILHDTPNLLNETTMQNFCTLFNV